MPDGVVLAVQAWLKRRRAAPVATAPAAVVPVVPRGRDAQISDALDPARCRGVTKSLQRRAGAGAASTSTCARRDPRPARAQRLGQVDLHQRGQRASIRSTGGTIRSRRARSAALPAHRIARRGIARTYQIPRPFAHMSVLENVALARHVRRPRRCHGASPRRGAALARLHRPRRQGRGAAGRAEPAPAQVPRAGARARRAAAAGAARRGAVGPDAGRDRRRDRADPRASATRARPSSSSST